MLRTRMKKAIPRALRPALQYALEYFRIRKMPVLHFDPGLARTISPCLVRDILIDQTGRADWARSKDHVLPAVTHRAGSGSTNMVDGMIIYHLVHHLRPCLVLEIGTHLGSSTVHMAAALRDVMGNGADSPHRCITVDIRDVNDEVARPWSKYGAKYSPRQMVEMIGCQEIVDFVIADSTEFLRSPRNRYDLVFLDGNHSAKVVYKEISLALRVLNPDGIILLHDVHQNYRLFSSTQSLVPGPYLAARRVLAENPSLEMIPLAPYTTFDESNRVQTTLAILGRRGSL